MKRDHVLITSLNLWILNHFIVDLSSLLVLENRIFFTHSIRSMLATLNWMRSYRYRREINRHWLISTHLDTDQKTIKQSAKNELWLMIYSFESHRSFLLVMKSEIIFRDFSYIWLRFLSLSVYSRCFAVRERIWSAGDLFLWISLNQIRVASQSEQFRSLYISQVVKFIQWRQILNHRIDQKNDES
jgi:hypothetical protein